MRTIHSAQILARTIAAIVLVLGFPAAVPATEPTAGRLSLWEDPVLAGLVRDALESRPELKQARSIVDAQRERVPQAGALPDPTLSLGIQNDGFRQINIGVMETSFWQVGVTQPFPWPGKRGLRADVAQQDVSQAEAALERARLGTVADVRRGYVDLLRVRDTLRLLGRLEILWERAEGLARARYQVGSAPQSDLLRAQLERTRLRQRRWALEADERARLQALNRLRAHPLDEPIATTATLAAIADPSLPAIDEALTDAEARSPELAQARATERQAALRVDLARRDRYPDFSVTAAVMPRGGFDPMWQLGVGITLPIWSKRSRAVVEGEARQAADTQGTEAVRQVLRLRTQERLTQLASVLQVNRLYRSGLLVQSEAAVESTRAQYQVGRVTFASVLEVLNAYVGDQQSYIDSAADAQRLAIAQEELSLSPSAGGAGPSGAGSVPGAGTSPSAAGPSTSSSGGGGAREQAPVGKSMGGM